MNECNGDMDMPNKRSQIPKPRAQNTPRLATFRKVGYPAKAHTYPIRFIQTETFALTLFSRRIGINVGLLHCRIEPPSCIVIFIIPMRISVVNWFRIFSLSLAPMPGTATKKRPFNGVVMIKVQSRFPTWTHWL